MEQRGAAGQLEPHEIVPLTAAGCIPSRLAASFGLPIFDTLLQPTYSAPATVPGPQQDVGYERHGGRKGAGSLSTQRHAAASKQQKTLAPPRSEQKAAATQPAETHHQDTDGNLELSSGQPATSGLQQERSSGRPPHQHQAGLPMSMSLGSMQQQTTQDMQPSSNQRGTTATTLHVSSLSDQMPSLGAQAQPSMSYPGSGGMQPLPAHHMLGGYPHMHPNSFSGQNIINPFGPQATPPGYGMYPGFPPMMSPYMSQEYAAQLLRQMQQQQQQGTSSMGAPPSFPGRSMDGVGEQEDRDRDDAARAIKRPRLVWTPQLHKRFEEAIVKLGDAKAVPKNIMHEMNVEGLTRENVASHLQKYRLQKQAREGYEEGLRQRGPEKSTGDLAGSLISD